MKRIKISVILLILVLMSTFTTAYAWLTLANVNRVQDISLNAIAQQDLLISLDGVNYSEEIPKELILNKLKKLKFDDVTTVDGVNYYSYFDHRKEARENKDYISLEIYFKTSSRYKELHLADNVIGADYETPPKEGTFITSKGRTFTSKVGYNYAPGDYVEEGETRKHYASEAMRVSFYSFADGTSKIFDLSGNEERGFGKAYGAVEYFNNYNGLNITPPQAPETIYNLSTFSDIRPIAESYESHLITLTDQGNVDQRGKTLYEGKLKMNIWLEAWDADAFDAIHYDQLKMQFMFKAVIPKHELYSN